MASVKALPTATTVQTLPNYDRDNSTCRNCIIGLILSWISIALCIAIALFIIVTDNDLHLFRIVTLSSIGSELLAFVINVILTMLTDSMGFIHASSLRWALYHEGRLEYNTNIRLFTSARQSWLNRWHTNILWIICLILSYGSTSQIFVRGAVSVSEDGAEVVGIFANGIAVATLALALLGQAVIATFCILTQDRNIATWSSNPLNNALALRHHELKHRAGRCMMSFSEKGDSSSPRLPKKRQKRIWASSKGVRVATIFVWVLAAISVIWAVTVTLLTRYQTLYDLQSTRYAGGSPWVMSFFWEPHLNVHLAGDNNDISLSMNPNTNHQEEIRVSLALQVFFGILFTCVVQGVQTMGLHCIELLVSIWRDENIWRAAYGKSGPTKRGARIRTNPIISALTSWPFLVLFAAKSFLHWVLGQCLLASFVEHSEASDPSLHTYSFDMVYTRIWTYAMGATSLAVFTTYLALRQPGGCLPATWGHFQTLADLIDNWDFGEKGDFWWGDRGVGLNGIRHAGTSGFRQDVQAIQMNARYAGLRNIQRVHETI